MNVNIRPFTAADIGFALEQTSREGWATSPEWFRLYLRHDPEGSLIAETDGRPVGMVTTTRYADAAWIGNLIVPPESRRRGIGRRLTSSALELLTAAGIRTVRLEADPPGIGIYRRLGFRDELESLRFRLDEAPPPAAAAPADSAIEPLTEALLPAAADFDRPRFGDHRARMLGLLLEVAETGCLLRRGGITAGYLMVLGTRSGLQIGPWIAADAAAAQTLLGEALRHGGGRRVTVGLPASNRAGRELLSRYGFTATPSSYRMVRGPGGAAGTPRNVFAIANGAIG
ncbi:MAG: GNAT family N-acetyltransferase [bacterium]|nr:GNAT family N-acetyltransferase [bacterium]